MTNKYPNSFHIFFMFLFLPCGIFTQKKNVITKWIFWGNRNKAWHQKVNIHTSTLATGAISERSSPTDFAVEIQGGREDELAASAPELWILVIIPYNKFWKLTWNCISFHSNRGLVRNMTAFFMDSTTLDSRTSHYQNKRWRHSVFLFFLFLFLLG